jgi:hypothetical protein
MLKTLDSLFSPWKACAHWKYNLQKGGLSLNNNAEKMFFSRTEQNIFLSSRELFDTNGRKTVTKELAIQIIVFFKIATMPSLNAHL